MDVVHSLWEEKSNIQRVKLFERCEKEETINRQKEERAAYTCCDGNLNFTTATCSEDDSEYGPYKKTKQDPLSHRIIEKRRRDRMNNCLADLSRLIPKEYLKKGRGRIEKTEIIEMAIKHLQYLQEQHDNPSDHFRLGYQECMSETMRFMVEVEGHFPREAVCVRLLNHLQKHCETLSKTTSAQQPAPINLMDIRFQKSSAKSVIQLNDFKSNSDKEVNNNTASAYDEQTNGFMESEIFEKHSDINGVSYKYKTDIKLRFCQDLNAGEKCTGPPATKKRRSSMTSLENHSSSQSSPPSDIYTRTSCESDNTAHSVSPSENTLCLDHRKNHTESNHEFPTYNRNLRNSLQNNTADVKANFNVPIFVLHAKGSFYVPLTIDYKTLLPFLQNYDLLVNPNLQNLVLHPVTINVNFQSGCNVKCVNYKLENGWN